MVSLTKCLVLTAVTASICCLTSGITPEGQLLVSMNEVLERIEARSQTLEEKNADMATKMEELVAKMTALEERDLQGGTMQNSSCNSDQLVALQKSISADIASVNQSIGRCSSKEDVDNIEELIIDSMCDHPFRFIRGLGCVFPVTRVMTWEDAKQNCKNQSSRLLEGITTQNQLDQLKANFDSTIGRYYVWLGIYRLKWHEGGDTVEPTSLFSDRQPDQGQECGLIYLYKEPPSFGDYSCTTHNPSLCQRSVNGK